MKKMSGVLIGFLMVTALALAPASGASAVQRKEQSRPAESVMLEKLDYAHKLLDAMVLEDFNAIRSNAEQLARLSAASGWRVMRTQEYSQFSGEFRGAAESLAEAARARNSEAAGAAYTKLTQGCIQCHAHIRHTRRASVR